MQKISNNYSIQQVVEMQYLLTLPTGCDASVPAVVSLFMFRSVTIFLRVDSIWFRLPFRSSANKYELSLSKSSSVGSCSCIFSISCSKSSDRFDSSDSKSFWYASMDSNDDFKSCWVAMSLCTASTMSSRLR